MKDKDKIGMVCARCDKITLPVPGSIEKKCTFCGIKVWVSPSSPKNINVLYCEDCFQLDYNEKEDTVSVTEETVDEFIKWQQEFGYEAKIEDIIKFIEETNGVKIMLETKDKKSKDKKTEDKEEVIT